MAKFPRLFLRPALIGVALAFVAAAPAFNATASSAQQTSASLSRSLATGISGAGAYRGPASPARTFHLKGHATCPTGHFVYAEAGTYLNPTSIAEYAINADCSLTAIGTVSTGGTLAQTGYGYNHIATSLANGPCVFYTAASGQAESYTVAANGTLTMVSSITVADGTTTYGGDTQVSANGKFLYVAAWGSSESTLNALSVGSGCALTLLNTVTASGASYEAMALLDSKGLDAIDLNTNTINIYSLNSNGSINKLVSSTPSQVSSADGAAFAPKTPVGPVVFNGIASFSAETEANTINSSGHLGDIPGSPASDPSGENSAHVFFDTSHGQLIAGEEISNSLGFYGKSGTSYALLGHSPVATASEPSAMAELGSELYVLGQGGPGLDACALSLGSATCSSAASVSPSAADGIGVL